MAAAKAAAHGPAHNSHAASTEGRPLKGGRTAPPKNPDALFLFDVDGTLTAPRLGVQPDMVEFLFALRDNAWVAVVGGSDQTKILEQLGAEAHTFFDYLFSENGLVAVKDGKEVARRQLHSHYCDADRKRFEEFCLTHIQGLTLPEKATQHVEARSGMWNVSPIGRTCTQQQRNDFEKYDQVHKIREQMVALLRPQFAAMDLSFAIGGQISFDVYPRGWDKTYCLRFLEAFPQIHFFGDKTYRGGNDYEIYSSTRTVGHCTKGPANTMQIIDGVFAEKKAVDVVEAGARAALTPLFASAAAPASVKGAATGADIVNAIVSYANYFFTE